MAIDLAKMRAKLDAARGKGGNKTAFWKPQEGKSTVRIVPTPDGDPFKQYWFHYNLAQHGFLSPKRNFNEDDALDEFVRGLWKAGSEDDKRLARDLMAKARYFAPVLVRGEEEKGVQIWGFGKMAYQQLLELVLNPDYGDITDTEDGTDLEIKYEKPAGASFPKTTITPRRRTSPMCDDVLGGTDECAKLLESIPDFDSLFERKTPAEVQELLNKYLDGASVSNDDVVKYTDNSSSVDDAFNDLMNS